MKIRKPSLSHRQQSCNQVLMGPSEPLMAVTAFDLMWYYLKEASGKKSKFLPSRNPLLNHLFCWQLQLYLCVLKCWEVAFEVLQEHPTPPTGGMLLNALVVASPLRLVRPMRLSLSILRSKASVQGPGPGESSKHKAFLSSQHDSTCCPKKQIQQPLIFKDDREQPLRQPNASFCITRLLQRQADGWSSLRVPTIEAAQLCVKL